jgi:transposase
MASRGRKRKAIAQDLEVHRTTIRLWLNQYQQRGVAGLQIQWAPGQAGRIPEALAPMLQKWVKEGPQSCGLDRANWTFYVAAVVKPLLHSFSSPDSFLALRYEKTAWP